MNKPVDPQGEFLVFGAPLIGQPEIDEVIACLNVALLSGNK